MNPIIRLELIELKNFKNIKQGLIECSAYRNKLFYTNKAEVIGIYGQNGSGKTAVVEAMQILKELMSAKTIPHELRHLIYSTENEAQLKFIFYIEESIPNEEQTRRDLITYEIVLQKETEKNNKIYISREKISSSRIGHRSKVDIILFDSQDKSITFLPKSRYQEVTRKNPDAVFSLEMAKRLSYLECRSFIFHPDVREVFHLSEANPDYSHILTLLNDYARMNLFVITNHDQKEYSIHSAFHKKEFDMVQSLETPISLAGVSIIKDSSFELAHMVIDQINLVINSMIPGLQIQLCDLGNELAEDGNIRKRVELVTLRNNIKVPIKYESEGIKKLLSILSTLISVYNNASVCVVVDELDSGIFEYLLGELLLIIERFGLGQMIFTSHNLRALEKLHKESIIISTANPWNRFIRIPHERGVKNYRNSYLRSLDLGGVDENIYQETNSYEISYAFRKAGELLESK